MPPKQKRAIAGPKGPGEPPPPMPTDGSLPPINVPHEDIPYCHTFSLCVPPAKTVVHVPLIVRHDSGVVLILTDICPTNMDAWRFYCLPCQRVPFTSRTVTFAKLREHWTLLSKTLSVRAIQQRKHGIEHTWVSWEVFNPFRFSAYTVDSAESVKTDPKEGWKHYVETRGVPMSATKGGSTLGQGSMPPAPSIPVLKTKDLHRLTKTRAANLAEHRVLVERERAIAEAESEKNTGAEWLMVRRENVDPAMLDIKIRDELRAEWSTKDDVPSIKFLEGKELTQNVMREYFYMLPFSLRDKHSEEMVPRLVDITDVVGFTNNASAVRVKFLIGERSVTCWVMANRLASMRAMFSERLKPRVLKSEDAWPEWYFRINEYYLMVQHVLHNNDDPDEIPHDDAPLAGLSADL